MQLHISMQNKHVNLRHKNVINHEKIEGGSFKVQGGSFTIQGGNINNRVDSVKAGYHDIVPENMARFNIAGKAGRKAKNIRLVF